MTSNWTTKPAMVLLLLTTVACGKQPTIDYKKITVEREMSLTDAKDSPHCEINLQLHQATGKHAANINQTIVNRLFDAEEGELNTVAQAFADHYTENYRKDMEPLYQDDRAVKERHRWYEYRYNVTTEVRHTRKGVSTYLINTDYYEGGAHGVKQLEVLNFDVSTGKLLTLDDFFVSGYQSQLSQLLLQALLKKTESKNLDELHDKGYLYSMDMFATVNYLPGDDDIVFVYNPYEIAPFDAGQIELTLDIDDLKEIMK